MMVLALFACKTVEVNVKKQAADGDIQYSYIDIDPLVIGKTWTQVEQVQLGGFVFEMYYINPDEDSPFHFATLMLTPAGIVGYSYMVDGVINVCEYSNLEQGYISTWDELGAENQALFYSDYATYFGLSES